MEICNICNLKHNKNNNGLADCLAAMTYKLIKLKSCKESLIEAAMFIEREAYLLKESETIESGSWPSWDVKEEYDRELNTAKSLRDMAGEL